MFDDFDLSYAKVNDVEINFRIKNNHNASENAILFLHGFPQTHAMWAGIADKFPDNYPIICSDLRGYGNSEKPKGVENFSFRHMAKDQLQLMSHLGFKKFHIVGHDQINNAGRVHIQPVQHSFTVIGDLFRGPAPQFGYSKRSEILTQGLRVRGVSVSRSGHD